MQYLSLSCYVSVDVDECSDPSLNSCDLVNGQCINAYGFYTCHCNTGYEGVRGICVGKITMHYIHVCSAGISTLCFVKISVAVTHFLIHSKRCMCNSTYTLRPVGYSDYNIGC